MTAAPTRRNTFWAKLAVCLLLVLIYREGVFHDVFRFYTSPAPEEAPPAASSSAACPGPAEGVAKLCYLVPFAWDFKENRWTWSVAIPKEDYDYFAALPRPAGAVQLATLAKDPRDDAVIADLTTTVRDAAKQAGFSEHETISFALSFVQSMRYTADSVGEGTDNYQQYPLETLVKQGGDCEDTTILGAALVAALGYGAALFIFPEVTGTSGGHAALGVAGTGLAGSWFTGGTTRYYYAEMTSSGYALGELPEMVRQHQPIVIPI